MTTIKIFKYIDELDCFIVSPDYKIIANKLGLNEWNEVVWIGRYFSLDNDNGEHWFDNWELRDKLESKAAALGIAYDDLLVIEPDRLKNDFDGPSHTGPERQRFWTDVLKCLEPSFDTIFAEAIKLNNELDKEDEEYIIDLEKQNKRNQETPTYNSLAQTGLSYFIRQFFVDLK